MRFSLLQLLAVLTVCALAAAGLARPTELAESLFFTFTLLAILAAAIAAAVLTGPARAYWLGFFMASASYLALVHVPDADEEVPRHNGPEFTTQLLRVLYNKIHAATFETIFTPDADWPDITDEGRLSLRIVGGQRIISDGTSRSFMRIGHSAWALLLGGIAGHFARGLYVRSRSLAASTH